MTSPLKLGPDPGGLLVKVYGDDWWTILRADTAWPSDAQAELRFVNGPTWAAVRSGTDLTWTQSGASQLANGQRVSLWYFTAGRWTPWADGKVQRA